ncbi:MAG: hypothetical protein ISS29_08065 [Candidatus Marinimicrobia bacterium]|nr:hypothetical protein [Candidatus Neomarinimicrobiota bacterium]
MELKPEEKRKIYKEEKARIEAREEIQETKKIKKNPIVTGIIYLLSIMLIIAIISLCTSESTPKVNIGSTAVLHNPSSWRVWMPIDKYTDREFTKALANGDEYKISKMVSEGKILRISNYTKIRVVGSSGIEQVRVRILEGDYLGREGIVFRKEIKVE